MTDNINDNDMTGTHRAAGSAPDPHGQAAMLLVESLIHGLIAKSVISASDAVEIVTVAADVKREIAFDLGDTVSEKEQSLAMLGAIARSLENDAEKDGA